MKLLIPLLFLSFLSSVVSCQNDYVIIGSGGGFSGEVTQYKIYPDGKVFKGSGIAEIKYTNSSKLSKCKAKKAIKQVNSLKSETFNKPGNMYYFIYNLNDAIEKKYTWGAAGFDAPEEITRFYRETITVISKLDYKAFKN